MKSDTNYFFAQIFNQSYIKLDDFISSLTPLDPVSSIDETAIIEACKLPVSSNLKTTISYLVHNLINKQFADNAKEALRELGSNAIDAQLRAGRECETVKLSLDQKNFTIEDQGDGIGWETLINYFVPGRSSNPRALFNLEEGIPQVTGRFGQGGLAVFSYLTDEKCDYLPTLERVDEEKTLKILYFQNEILHEALFKVSKDTNEVTCTTRILPANIQKTKKLTIQTKRAEEALKLKFWEVQGSIVFDIKRIEKTIQGTRFKIRSPLFEKNYASLKCYLIDTFRFVKNTPLTLNGERINTLEAFNSLEIKGLTLLYSAPATEGTLFVCEGGKVISSFKLEGTSVPKKMAVDFERLPLTQDRSTLNVKDEKTIQILKSLIEHIFTTSTIKLDQKGMLLNALYPLLDNQQFKLVEFVKRQIILHSQQVLPDIKSLSKQESVLYLKTEYLSCINLPIFHQKNNYSLYLVDMNASAPIDIACIDKNYHLFLDKNLFNTVSAFDLRTKLAFLNQWLEHKNCSISLNIEEIVKSKIKLEMSTSYRETVSNFIETNNTNEYQIVSNPYHLIHSIDDARKVLAELVFPDDVIGQQKIIEDFYALKNAFYFNPACPTLALKQNEFWMQHPEEFDAIYNTLFTFTNFFFQNRSIKKQQLSFTYETIKKGSLQFAEVRCIINRFTVFLMFYAENLCKLSPELECKTTFAFLLEQVKNEIEIKDPSARDYFDSFVMNGIIQDKLHDISEMDYTKIADYYTEHIRHPFQRLYQVTQELPPFPSNSLEIVFSCNDANINAAHLSKFKETSFKIINTNSRLNFLLYAKNLADPEFWKGLNNDQLNLLADLLPSSEKFLSLMNNKPISTEGYQNLLIFAEQVSLPVEIKAQWASIFFYMMEIHSCMRIGLGLPLNTKQFLKILITFANSKKLTDEEFKALLEDMQKTTHEFLYRFLNPYLAILKAINAYTSSNSEALDEKSLVVEITKNLKPSQVLRGFESLEASVEAVLRSYKQKSDTSVSAILQRYLPLLEKIGVIKEKARPFIYAAFTATHPNLLLRNYISPLTFNVEQAIPLQQDKDVIEAIGSEKLATVRIQGAQKQISKEGVWVLEVLKNSRESASTTLDFSSHTDIEGNYVCVVKDNGSGISLEGLKALKSPGTTSKIREGDNPNFGWGFFTLFAEFNEVQVISSTIDGIKVRLIFKKVNEDIFLQTSFDKEAENAPSQGVTLILKKKAVDIGVEAITLNAQIVNYSQYLKDITVKLNGIAINNTGVRKPVLEYSEPYVNKGDIKVQIGWWEGGIYFNDNRIDRLNKEFLHFLPKKLKKLLAKNKCELSVFLPTMQQIMNRSQLINQEDLMLATQMAVLKTCLQYAAKKLQNGNVFDLLSKDYWDDFRNSYKAEVTLLDKSTNERDEKKNSALTQAFKQFFNTLDEKSLSFPYQIQSIGSLLEKVMEKDRSEYIKQQLIDIKIQFKDTRIFSHYLASLPLQTDGISLLTIRDALIESLTSLNILENRQYNETYILNTHATFLTKSIQKAIQQVKKTLNLDDDYTPVLNKFQTEIIRKIHGHHVQKQKLILADEICKPLAHFMVEAAKKLLGKDINIHFFAEANGVKAYTHPQSNDLYINKQSPQVQLFLDFLVSCQNKEAMHKLESENLKIVVEWLDTLIHEVVHMHEENSCSDTHDAHFYKQMAHLFGNALHALNSADDSPSSENAILLLLKELHQYIPGTMQLLKLREEQLSDNEISDDEMSDEEISDDEIENELIADPEMENSQKSSTFSLNKRGQEEVNSGSEDNGKDEPLCKKFKHA